MGQFRAAQDLGAGLYRLSHIRREMRGTTGTGSSHAIGDPFVLINRAVKRVEHNLEDAGKTFDFIAPSYGEELDEAIPFSFTYGGKGIEPGGTTASAPQNVVVQESGPSDILRWNAPAANSETIDYYVVNVGTGLSGSNVTGVLSGYADRIVGGLEFILPVDASYGMLYYSVQAHNAFGLGTKATGSYDALLDFVAASVTVEQLEASGDISADGVIKVSGEQVIGARQSAISDATDAASAITQLNAALAMLRAHGLIDT